MGYARTDQVDGKGGYSMTCPECGKKFPHNDLIEEVEDRTATIPYGDTFIDVDRLIVRTYCPYCDNEIEEL